jgi:hypothetical protein
MALIKCPNCNGTVSTKASACPHCGNASYEHLSEKQRLEKLADELGSMSAAFAAIEGDPIAPRQNVQASITSEPIVAPCVGPVHPHRVYTTGDIILHSILLIAVAIFFVPIIFMLVAAYFEERIEVPMVNGTGALNVNPENFRPPKDWKPAQTKR